MRPGIPERRTHDCKPNGTTPPFAALDLAAGFIIGKCRRRHRSKELPDFLKETDTRVPKGSDIHIVMDNPAIPKTRRRQGMAGEATEPAMPISRRPRPPGPIRSGTGSPNRRASKQPQRGVHSSARQPEADIRAFIERYNRNTKPFRWTKSVDDIPNAVKRFRLRVNHNYAVNFNFG